MTLYVGVNPPHEWAKIDPTGAAVGTGIAESLADLEPPNSHETVVGVAPGEEVITRAVALPSRRRDKVLAALPYALEEYLSADIETLHFALLDWKPGATATAAVVARDRLEGWLAAFTEAGILLDALIPDYLLLPLHPQASYTVAVDAEGRVCIREPDLLGVVLDRDTVPYWWHGLDRENAAVAVNERALARELIADGGVHVSEWDIGVSFGQWVAHHRVPPSANLLQGAYRPRTKRSRSRPLALAAGIFGVALAVKVGADIAEYLWLARRAEQLDTQIRQVFTDTFPEITRIVDPRAQMKRQLELLGAGQSAPGEFQRLLASVARAVPRANATLEEISFRDNVMVVSCNAPDFAGLDRLKQQFESEPQIQAELLSSGSRDNRVSGRFQLRSGV